MYKLWCIFLMQLFNFTPLKRYDVCAGALALTLGGGPKLECYGTGARVGMNVTAHQEKKKNKETKTGKRKEKEKTDDRF